jgi:AcrR family transcriptional regulator
VGAVTASKRAVGRPRQFDDESEQRLLMDAAYKVLRDADAELTISAVLERAGVSTRAFYRHFESKDALLREMYLRDARWVAARLSKRLAGATSPRQAVEWWIDELFGFTRDARRAERVAVLGSILGRAVDGVESVAVLSRALLNESLQAAIAAGIEAGSFAGPDPAAATELVAAATMHAAGLVPPYQRRQWVDQSITTAFCLAALRKY